MQALKKYLTLASVLCTFAGPALAAESVKLTSTDWPPFSSEKLPAQGATTAVVMEAFKQAGIAVTVDFLPWQEAVDKALKADGYVGYFPEYFSAALAQDTCRFSKPIGVSPLGFVEKKDKPVVWKTLDDLKGMTIGTVEGYVNEAEFDKRAAAGELTVSAAADDATNVKKVAAGEVALAVIDRNVLQYLLNFDPALSSLRGAVRFNAKPLEDKQLLVCFRRNAEGEAAKQKFDAALAKIDVGLVQGEVLRMLDR